jgi:hypothetical protein
MQRKWTLQRSSLASKHQSLLTARASVPDSAFADAAGHPTDSKSDDAESTRATIYPPATEPQVQRLHRQSLASAWLSPASTVMSNCGYDRGYVRTPRLRRRADGFARVKKLLVTGAVGATVAGAVEIWFLASLPQQAPPPLPGAQPPELSAPVAAGEAGRVAEKMELPRTTAPERGSTSASTPIASAELTPTATPESRAIARAESIWIARLGPALESPRINQAPPHLGKATDRASLLLRDTDVRYLSRAELQTLSADQLHIARNEIFARRGRFFKDDALRAYFLQFPWYRPHAWEVPLSLVEQANVARIQSVEEANLGSAQSIEAPVAPSRAIAGPLPAQTNAENAAPFAELGRRYLTREELQGLPADQLAIVRNQIFARRGRYFKDDWLRAYFSQFPWYRPYAWDVPLSPLEQANVKLVQSLEQTAAAPRPASRSWRGPPM